MIFLLKVNVTELPLTTTEVIVGFEAMPVRVNAAGSPAVPFKALLMIRTICMESVAVALFTVRAIRGTATGPKSATREPFVRSLVPVLV